MSGVLDERQKVTDGGGGGKKVVNKLSDTFSGPLLAEMKGLPYWTIFLVDCGWQIQLGCSANQCQKEVLYRLVNLGSERC